MPSARLVTGAIVATLIVYAIAARIPQLRGRVA